MRQLNINIYPRTGTNDLSYSFVTQSNTSTTNVAFSQQENNIYEFQSLELNYTILNSTTTSTLILSMNQPPTPDNVLRSGQPVEVTDNGQTVFQGVILSAQYQTLSMHEDSQGGTFLYATLAPSIYQFSISPFIFDSTQASQIQQLTGVDVNAIIAGNVTQSIDTEILLEYVVSNMDYLIFFNKGIAAQDLSSSVYLMASIGQSRDEVLRSSINFYNCVFYQQENGDIIIRQLDGSLKCPFAIDLTNQYNGNAPITGDPTLNNGTHIVPMLTYNYTDNAYSTPAAVSNYAIIPPGVVVANKASSLVLTYAPNPKFFPRLQQLQKSGWFVGDIGKTQINQNIINNPTVAAALQAFQSNPDQYMQNVTPSNVTNNSLLPAYQSLLTAKQLGNDLTGYASLNGTISLDDINLPPIGNITGTIINIQNCDLTQGILATSSRSYSAEGSYLNFSILPLGSITGYYKNS